LLKDRFFQHDEGAKPSPPARTPPSDLARELDAANAALAEKKRFQLDLDREIIELRTLLRESERQLTNIRRTLSYRLGAILVDARNFKGIRALPKALYMLWLIQRAKRHEGVGSGRENRPSDRLRYVEDARQILKRDGHEAVVTFVATLPERQTREKARVLIELAHDLRVDQPAEAAKLAMAGAQLNPSESRLRSFAFELYDDGDVKRAAALLDVCDPAVLSNAAQIARAAAIKSDAAELVAPVSIPPRERSAKPASTRLAIVAPRSLPSHAEALTYRARSVANSAAAGGAEVLIFTEPGYRYGTAKEGLPRKHASDIGVTTVHLAPVSVHRNDVLEWVAATTAILKEQFSLEGIGAVHSIADVPLSIAAALAARACGLSFTLDIGSIPSAGGEARDGWASTERFAASWSRLENVARSADRVIIRSQTLAAAVELQAPGLAFEIVPDAIPDIFVGAGSASIRDIRRELGLADDRPLIGIIGETNYGQGLLDVIRALPHVRKVIADATVVYCGPGRIGQTLRRTAALESIGDGLIVPDGYTRQRLAQYLSAFAVTVFPQVEGFAGMATPFEQQVALALGTPIVAVDSLWSTEFCASHSSVRIVTKGDLYELANAIVNSIAPS
jgi:glycosyltransferase involved in cell wall biosynthesis